MSKRSRRKHSSFRDMVDAGSELGTTPFDDEFDNEFSDQEEEDEDTEERRVVMGTFADLAMGPSSQSARPLWFLRDEDADQVGVFERYPEERMPEQLQERLLGGLRDFATTHASKLQTLLGSTERLHYGFHTSAELHEVVESFEDDGFEILLGLEDGAVAIPSDPP